MNRTLTQWAARAGNGVEILCGLGEDPERVAKLLLARTTAPIVTDLRVEGDALRETASSRLPDLYAGAPSLIPLSLVPEGGTLTVRGRTAEGEYVERVDVAAIALGEGLPAVATLFGRERVEDLETEATATCRGETDEAIEAAGLTFQIATRLTSWVAVSDDVTVDPEVEKRAVRQPHELAHGVSIEGLGLRAASAPFAAMSLATPTGMPMPMPMPPRHHRCRHAAIPSSGGAAPSFGGGPARSKRRAGPPPPPSAAAPEEEAASERADRAEAPIVSPPTMDAGAEPVRTESAPAEAAKASESGHGSTQGRPMAEREDALEDVARGADVASPDEGAQRASERDAKKSGRRWIWIVLFVLTLLGLAAAAWLARSSDAPAPARPARTTEAPLRE